MLNQLLKDPEMGFVEHESNIYPPLAGGIAKEAYLNRVHNYNTALTKQVGGNHYKKFKIQPVEFCYENSIPYLEATAIKYLCRWRDKGGLADLDKAIHFIELLKGFEMSKETK